jgi:hypothetical protein
VGLLIIVCGQGSHPSLHCVKHSCTHAHTHTRAHTHTHDSGQTELEVRFGLEDVNSLGFEGSGFPNGVPEVPGLGFGVWSVGFRVSKWRTGGMRFRV